MQTALSNINGMRAAPLRSHRSSRSRVTRVSAFWNKKTPTAVVEAEPEVEEPKKKLGLFSSAVSTLEGAVPRSKQDAELLYDAKYGKRGEDGKMSREQYAALRRKIGGTGKDFFKEWVEEDVVTDTYTKVGATGGTVPFLPVLLGITAAVLISTVLVVAQTGGQ